MTRNVSRLPFFPDKRKQGIAAMERALVEAQIVRPVVQLVLVYTYIDERRYDDAITLGEDLALRYPNSTLVRVQLGRAWSRKGRYSRALDAFREVERLQPDHKLIRYYLGANLMYEGKDLDTARGTPAGVHRRSARRRMARLGPRASRGPLPEAQAARHGPRLLEACPARQPGRRSRAEEDRPRTQERRRPRGGRPRDHSSPEAHALAACPACRPR